MRGCNDCSCFKMKDFNSKGIDKIMRMQGKLCMFDILSPSTCDAGGSTKFLFPSMLNELMSNETRYDVVFPRNGRWC
jgi:hypothetical protein